jgi:hypothetical protein
MQNRSASHQASVETHLLLAANLILPIIKQENYLVVI